VSTATSIIVLSQGQPAGLTLQAAGQVVPLAPPVALGPGADGLVGGLSVWQIRAATADGMLPPSAEQVLTAQFQGSAVEVTRFTTAAGYDKVQGVAPVARAVHLWRVRYPLSEISSGDCVFAEYHGFITVDYDPATVPNTPSGSVIHTFSLAPKTGGSAQTFAYVGDAPFTGTEPVGDHPLPTGAWQPELDPTREYCLGISAFGDGDIARLPLTSDSVCASVVQISSLGAPPSGGSMGGGGGCAVAPAPRSGGAVALLVLGFAVAAGRRRRR
jgi:MYXO-CTERM domain-containing protein